MSKCSKVFGIDISKMTIDVADSNGNHRQFTNKESGFIHLLKYLPKDSGCIMEATGIYHLPLANFLFKHKISVCVVNPLSVKRFIQMHLQSNKTDKSDAKMLALYARNVHFKEWQPASEIMDQAHDMYGTMEQFIDMRAGLKSKLDALKFKKSTQKLIDLIQSQIDSIGQTISKLEMGIETLIISDCSVLLTNLKSIPGIGKRTALLLIIAAREFSPFQNAKQVCSFFGLAPREYSSGSSIKSRSKITKMGNALVRKKLFMCSLQASIHNTACAALYKRLLAKGKPKKLALIAVANKLLKISFAIAQSGMPYDPQYRSAFPVAH